MSAPSTLAGKPQKVTQEQLRRYADSSGDHNPLHLNEAFAATSMFGRTIAHGMLVLAFVSEMMSGSFGERWARGGSLKVRFRAPVFPGDHVKASGALTSEVDGVASYSITVRNGEGTEVISGEASVQTEAS